MVFPFEYKGKIGDIIVANKTFLSDSQPQINIQEGTEMMVQEIDSSNELVNVDSAIWEKTEWIGPVNFMNITKKQTVIG